MRLAILAWIRDKHQENLLQAAIEQHDSDHSACNLVAGGLDITQTDDLGWEENKSHARDFTLIDFYLAQFLC